MNHHILRLCTGVLLTTALAAFIACGPSKPVLHVYNWSDYFAEGLLEQFEEEFDCRVILDTYDSNEFMVSKLQAGASGYDVIFPSSYVVPRMVQDGLLRVLDHDNLPNLANIDRDFIENVSLDKGMVHSVPYMSGTTGIAYRADSVQDFEPTWRIFERADLAGRMTLLNDPREVLGAALKVLGYSLNTTSEVEINEAADLVIEWKRHIARFDSEAYKAGIASQEFFLVQGWSGDVMQVIEANNDPDIVFALPREGFPVWEDTVAIPATADNVELAEAFINFLHRPDVAAANMTFNYYLCPNEAAYELLDEEMRNDPIVFVPDELMSRSEQVLDVGEHLAKYSAAWDRVKAAN